MKIKTILYNNLTQILISILLFVNITMYNKNTLMIYIILSTIIFCITIIYCWKEKEILKKLIKLSAFWWLTLVFIMYEIYGLFFKTYTEFNWDYILFLYLTIISAVLLLMKEKDISSTIVNVSVISSLMSIIYVCIREGSSLLSGNIRIGVSASGNVITFATYLCLLSIPVLYEAFYSKKRKSIYIIIYCIQLLFMLLTGSKKVLIVALISVVVFSIYKYRLDFRKYIIILISILLISIAVIKIPFLRDIIGARTIDFLAELGFNVESHTESRSTMLRESMYKEAPIMFKDNPIFGGGWGYFAAHSITGLYSHCNYIEILITFGIIGFLLYYVEYVIIFIKLLNKKYDGNKILWIVLLISIFVSDLTSITFYLIPICYIMLFGANIFIVNEEKK